MKYLIPLILIITANVSQGATCEFTKKDGSKVKAELEVEGSPGGLHAYGMLRTGDVELEYFRGVKRSRWDENDGGFEYAGYRVMIMNHPETSDTTELDIQDTVFGKEITRSKIFDSLRCQL